MRPPSVPITQGSNRANNLGVVLRDLGNSPWREDSLRTGPEDDETAFGLNHPEVATDANNLGQCVAGSG